MTLTCPLCKAIVIGSNESPITVECKKCRATLVVTITIAQRTH